MDIVYKQKIAMTHSLRRQIVWDRVTVPRCVVLLGESGVQGQWFRLNFNFRLELKIMKKTAQEMRMRIHKLTAKGETMNAALINKAKRQLRKLEAEEKK